MDETDGVSIWNYELGHRTRHFRNRSEPPPPPDPNRWRRGVCLRMLTLALRKHRFRESVCGCGLDCVCVCVCDQSLPHTHPPRSGERSAQADTPNSTTVTSLNWLNASGPSLLSVASDDGVVRVWGGLMETDSSRWVRWSGRALAAYPSGVRVEVNAL